MLWPTKVDYQGQMKDAIRVDEDETRKILQTKLQALKASRKAAAPVAGKPKPMTQAEIDAEIGPDPADDIPF